MWIATRTNALGTCQLADPSRHPSILRSRKLLALIAEVTSTSISNLAKKKNSRLPLAVVSGCFWISGNLETRNHWQVLFYSFSIIWFFRLVSTFRKFPMMSFLKIQVFWWRRCEYPWHWCSVRYPRKCPIDHGVAVPKIFFSDITDHKKEHVTIVVHSIPQQVDKSLLLSSLKARWKSSKLFYSPRLLGN